MADSCLKQIWNNSKALIEAIAPRTYWSNGETFRVISDAMSDNTVQNDANHRYVYLCWMGSTEDVAALSLQGMIIRNRILHVQVAYQATFGGRSSLEKASQMAAEDSDDIISTLQRLSTFPVITGGGYIYHRLYVDGSEQVAIDADLGKLILSIDFKITYKA